MFSVEITQTDAFFDMPAGSQLLYFHLGMNADDDGFISSAKSVMRTIGSSEDEFKVLLAKKFLLKFDNGLCIIKHWRINNQIRKDRYTETKYLKEKSSLYIRENGSYTLNPDGAKQLPNGHLEHHGNQMATKWQPSIGKYSIGKVSIDNTNVPDWLNKKAWDEWQSYRKERGKKLTARTIKMQLSFLEEHKKDHVKIIETSILNGWTGLFPLGKKLEQGNKAKAYDERIESEREERELKENAEHNEKVRSLSNGLDLLSKTFSKQ